MHSAAFSVALLVDYSIQCSDESHDRTLGRRASGQGSPKQQYNKTCNEQGNGDIRCRMYTNQPLSSENADVRKLGICSGCTAILKLIAHCFLHTLVHGDPPPSTIMLHSPSGGNTTTQRDYTNDGEQPTIANRVYNRLGNNCANARADISVFTSQSLRS